MGIALTSRLACASIAILSCLLVFSWTAARIHYAFGGNWTALFCTGVAFPVPPELDAGTYRFPHAGYDGQFYRYMAHDPFLHYGYFRFIDNPQLRFRRILVPLAAWLLGGGQREWIDSAYIAVEMLFVALGVYWSARLMARRGRSPLWGLLFLALPATMASFDRMLVDGPLLALFAGFVLYCEERRWTRVWILALLAALTRETGLLLAGALVTDRLIHRDWRRAAWFSASIVPAAAWYAFLAARLRPGGSLPVAIPGWAILRRLFIFRHYPDPHIQQLLRVTDVLAVVGLIVSLALAVRWILSVRLQPVTISVGFFAAMALLVAAVPDYMIDAYAFGRPVSPLLFWVLTEAVTRKNWLALAPPLLVSLSVAMAFANPLVAVMKGLARAVRL